MRNLRLSAIIQRVEDLVWFGMSGNGAPSAHSVAVLESGKDAAQLSQAAFCHLTASQDFLEKKHRESLCKDAGP